jgi:sugar phosphate isomerase/epimerase
MRIFAGNLQPGQSLAEAQKNCVESIEACTDHAARRGVLLGLENHGGIVAEADSLLAIVKAVRSDFVGINLDSGNFRTDDPYGDLTRIAPWAVSAQIKTEIQPRGQEKHEADLGRIVGILKESGFRGYARAGAPPGPAVAVRQR